MEIKLDAIDRRIIQLLQQDGKMKIKEIAEQLNMTNTPIFERIKRLERDGYIEGYSAKVNKKKMGFGLMAFCSISLELHNEEYIGRFVEEISDLDEVIECYHIAGMFDYLMKIYVQDMEHYQTFITKKLAALRNIGKVQSSFVMTEIKSGGVLPL